MLLPPTRFDPPLSLTFLHSRRTHPSHRPSTFCLFHYSHPSSWPLSLRRFPIYEVSTPLLTALRHHCAFATIPQCSLGLRVGVGGLRTRESGWWATLGTTSSTKKSVYRTTARGVLLYVVFSRGLEGRHSSGARIRNPPTIRGAWIDGRACTHSHWYGHQYIECFKIFVLRAFLRIFLISFLIFLKIKNRTLRFIYYIIFLFKL